MTVLMIEPKTYIMMFMITSDQEKITIQDYQNCWPAATINITIVIFSFSPSIFMTLVSESLKRLLLMFFNHDDIFHLHVAFSTLMLHFLPG